jgi:hypothetical protein
VTDQRQMLARAIAAAPVQRRDFSFTPGAMPQPGQASVGMPGSGFRELDTRDPTARMMLAAGIGQTVQDTGRLYGLAETAAGGSGGITQAARGIRAFHGSPHDFDRFRMDRIGTGEGAQVYGHGLYFAEAEDVARSYRDGLAPPSVAIDGVNLGPLGERLGKGLRGGVHSDQIQALGRAGRLTSAEQDALYFLDGASDAATAVQNLRDQAGMVWRGPDAQKIWRERADTLERLVGRVKVTPQGRMYEVNLNVDPTRLLDWDAPIARNSPAVDAMMQARAADAARRGLPGDVAAEQANDALRRIEEGGMTGAGLYRGMAGGTTPADATAMLRDAGIPGIRYLDGGSRAAGDGTRNYVMFDDNLVEILRKYGFFGPAVGAGAAVSQGETQQ